MFHRLCRYELPVPVFKAGTVVGYRRANNSSGAATAVATHGGAKGTTKRGAAPVGALSGLRLAFVRGEPEDAVGSFKVIAAAAGATLLPDVKRGAGGALARPGPASTAAHCVVSLAPRAAGGTNSGPGGGSAGGAGPSVVGSDWLTESVLSGAAQPLLPPQLCTFPAGRRVCSVGEAVLVQRDRAVEAVIIDSVTPEGGSYLVAGRTVRRGGDGSSGSGGGIIGSGSGSGSGGSGRATCIARCAAVSDERYSFMAAAVLSKVVLLPVSDLAWADTAFGCDREVWAAQAVPASRTASANKRKRP
jgi:hypothetical protein